MAHYRQWARLIRSSLMGHFDSVQTALNCLNLMSAGNQYYLMANDDIMIMNACNVILLVLATTFQNQKLMNSYTFCYINGEVMGVHRNSLIILNWTDALLMLIINDHRQLTLRRIGICKTPYQILRNLAYRFLILVIARLCQLVLMARD